MAIREITIRDGKKEETFRYLTGEVKQTPTGYVVTIKVVETDPQTKRRVIKTQQSTFALNQVVLIVPKDAVQTIALFKANIYLKKVLDQGGGATTKAATTRATQATTPAAIKNKAELDEAVILVLEAYDKLMSVQRMARKKNLEQDPANFQGLAKSHFALKQYSKALPFYRQLTLRLDPNKNPEAYWKAQLGYCRCALEMLRQVRNKLKENVQENRKKLQQNTEALEGVRAYMRQVDQEDSNWGGYYEEKNRIKAELRSLLGE